MIATEVLAEPSLRDARSAAFQTWCTAFLYHMPVGVDCPWVLVVALFFVHFHQFELSFHWRFGHLGCQSCEFLLYRVDLLPQRSEFNVSKNESRFK